MIHSNNQKAELAAALLIDGEADRLEAGEDFDGSVLNSFHDLQSPGDSDFLRELVDLYMTEAADRINAMKMAVAANNSEALKRAAHALKGSSATLGLVQIVHVCESLERTSYPDSTHRADGLIQLLIYRFGKTRAQLSRRLQDTSE